MATEEEYEKEYMRACKESHILPTLHQRCSIAIDECNYVVRIIINSDSPQTVAAIGSETLVGA